MTNTSLQFYRGDDVTINVTVQDSDDNAIDITGYTFWFTMKKQQDDTDAQAVIQKSVTSHTTPASGLTAFSLSKTDTNIAVDSYYYDIQMKDASGNVQTLTKGQAKVIQDITQSTS